MVREPLAERLRIADLIVGRVYGAGKVLAHVGQRRLQRERLVVVDDPDVASALTLPGGPLPRAGELGFLRQDGQLTGATPGKVDLEGCAQFVQQLCGAQCNVQHRQGVLARPLGRALAQELNAPGHHGLIAETGDAYRRIAAEHEPGHTCGEAWLAQRIGVAVGKLGAVRMAGGRGDGIGTVDDNHVVTGLAQVVGGRQPDDAGAQDNNWHLAVFFRSWFLVISRRRGLRAARSRNQIRTRAVRQRRARLRCDSKPGTRSRKH